MKTEWWVLGLNILPRDVHQDAGETVFQDGRGGKEMYTYRIIWNDNATETGKDEVDFVNWSKAIIEKSLEKERLNAIERTIKDNLQRNRLYPAAMPKINLRNQKMCLCNRLTIYFLSDI